MHELSVTQSLLDIATEQAGKHNASTVTRISLVVGEISGVEDECMPFYFELLARDTVASGATLCIERVPMKARCRDCGLTFPLSEFNWACANCRGTGVELVSGREFYIDSMEME